MAPLIGIKAEATLRMVENFRSTIRKSWPMNFTFFSIVWTPTAITWYLDDVQYEVIDTTPADLSELQNKFYFIFNVAVGGNWPGNPDATTTFPQRMIVDYVRIFQNN